MSTSLQRHGGAPIFQVREPTERLGVGSPGTENDLNALKHHPFFKPINWEKLWTDPVPPLEVGLFKKEHLPPSSSNSTIWDDVEAAWDDIMAEDEMAWASDTEGPECPVPVNGYLIAHIRENELLGPTDIPPGFQSRRSTGSTIQGIQEIKQQLVREHTGKESPFAVDHSPATETSSSEDRNIIAVPPATLSVSLLQPTTQAVSSTQDSQESERGRNSALSPKQGHGLPPELGL